MKLYYETKPDELLHYVVPGMKWGVRRSKAPTSGSNTRFGSAKAKYKAAKKAYNKAYNRAEGYSSSHPISQFIGKKQKAESNKRWYDAHTKARELDAAKKEYKSAKADRKAKLKAAKADYKAAKKAYNRAYNRAEGYSGRHFISQYTNKNVKAESNKRWNDAYTKGRELDAIKKKYKAAKKKK